MRQTYPNGFFHNAAGNHTPYRTQEGLTWAKHEYPVQFKPVNNPRTLNSTQLSKEMAEREKRKKSIVVAGINTHNKGPEEEAARVIFNATNTLPVVRQVKSLRGSRIILELKSLSNKVKILRRKDNLLDQGISLDDDLTSREFKIQEWLGREAEILRTSGIDAALGYQKLRVHGTWWRWSEGEGRL